MPTYLAKVLITGSEGQLGSALYHHPLAAHFKLVGCTRQEMDITDANAIEQAIISLAPDIIINTAAYTMVDRAEQEIEKAEHINHFGAHTLASACHNHGIPLIHLSTDYVFDGEKGRPYLEDDATHPINYYGKTKCLGEIAVRAQQTQHIILRVSGVFSEYGTNFLKTMLRLVQEKKALRVIADQMTCPTYAGDIAKAVYTMLMQPLHFGTYHFCSLMPVTWHQFATAILNQPIQAITSADYPTAAKRPVHSVLDCSKIQSDYGIMQPSWEIAIKTVLTLLSKEK